MLKENDIAPDFKLESTEYKEVSLSDFAGKNIVLYFYPKDATPGCTIEANDFNKHLDEFRKFDCVVLGISRDNVASHKKFIAAQCLAFPLLSDPEGEVCKKYGVWNIKNMFGKKYYGIQRSTFLIGKNQNIVKAWYKVNPLGHANAVLQSVKLLV